MVRSEHYRAPGYGGTSTRQVLDGKITGHAALDAIGGYAATHIQQFMVDLKHPPNAPITIARKGSSNPLIDTGQLMNSVTWQVVRTT